MPNNRNENVELRLDTNTLRPLSGAGRKLFVETYGCQMNVGDTEIVVSVMQREGYVYTERIDEADVILINTCSIRDNAEQRIWGRLAEMKRYRRANPGLVVGVIGCMAAAVCKKAGAKTVVITDINDFRLGLARTLGADRTVNVTREKLSDVMKELEMTEGFDVCLEMSGAPSCLKDIIDNSRNGASISLLGIQPDGSSIEWNKFIWKGLKMKGIYGREIFETWHKMDSMIRSGLDIAPIITHRLPYTEFREGFEAMNSGKSGKVVLDWVN